MIKKILPFLLLAPIVAAGPPEFLGGPGRSDNEGKEIKRKRPSRRKVRRRGRGKDKDKETGRDKATSRGKDKETGKDKDKETGKDRMTDTRGYSMRKQVRGKAVGRKNIPDTARRGINRELDWYDLYAEAPDSVEEVELDMEEGFRAVAEVVLPAGDTERQNQEDELAFFQDRGYDTLVFVWYGENANKTAEFVSSLSEDWNVLFAISRKGNTYKNPNRVGLVLSLVEDSVDGVIPLWRKTSNPHWRFPDEAKARLKIIGSMTDLPVLGEYYRRFGEEDISTGVQGESAVLLHNAGHVNAMPEVQLKMSDKPMIPVITGPPPFYTSRDITDGEVWNLKQSVGRRYIDEGARGVVTLVGDGRGEGGDNTDQLTRSRWRDRAEGDQ